MGRCIGFALPGQGGHTLRPPCRTFGCFEDKILRLCTKPKSGLAPFEIEIEIEIEIGIEIEIEIGIGIGIESNRGTKLN
jgi:hypothetical protein